LYLRGLCSRKAQEDDRTKPENIVPRIIPIAVLKVRLDGLGDSNRDYPDAYFLLVGNSSTRNQDNPVLINHRQEVARVCF
jgi:hypothetical protein